MKTKIKIIEIKDQNVWDSFLKSSKYKSFLQSWDWSIFQSEGLKKKIWRIGFENEKKELIGICLAVEEDSRFGRFVYCPRGPIINWENPTNRGAIITELQNFFRGKGYIFLRIDPAVKKEMSKVEKELVRAGFENAMNFVQVERAWMLDIKDRTDEEIMSEMRKNTRYSLRKSMKAGLDVKISKDESDLEVFVTSLTKLAERKGFPSLPESYLLTQFKTLGIERDLFKLITVWKDNNFLAGGIFAFFENESSYLHGVSSDVVGDTQAPYLVQWEAIKLGQKLGIQRHNFWGVINDDHYSPKHPGFGYSNFKRGFGGYLEEYFRTKDYPYDIRYQLIRLNDWYRSVRYKVA